MDKGTGTIIVAKPLDAEQKSNYNLTVEATDGTTTILTQVGEGLITESWSGGPQAMGTVDTALCGSHIRSYCVDTVYIHVHTEDFYLGNENSP